MGEPIPCPFVYANRKSCSGHIIRIETYKADAEWVLQEDGTWSFGLIPLTHYHLFCSEKGNHAGYVGPDNEQMKFRANELGGELAEIVFGEGTNTDIGKTLKDACAVLEEPPPKGQNNIQQKGMLDSLLPEGITRDNVTSTDLDEVIARLDGLAEWHFRQAKAWRRISHITFTQGTEAVIKNKRSGDAD